MAEMLENTDWSQLLTKPMSEAELAQYQSVLDSDAFQDVVRSYHASAALTAIREVLLARFKEGFSLESVITALANIWLDCMLKVESRMSDKQQKQWRSQPQLLVQILFMQAAVTMQEHESALERRVEPELRELAQTWAPHLPEPMGEIRDDEAALAQQVQQLQLLYPHFVELRTQLEATELRLDATDYLEVWTLILLQTLIFGQLKQPELYFTIETNWDLFLDKLSSLVALMCVIEDDERFLLPENRLQLAALVQTPEFNARVERYLEQAN